MTGAGHYVDDLQPEGCLHIAFVRSTLAHAEIRSLDVQAAAAAPGVVAVLTGADLGLPDRVGFAMVAATLARAPLATERVRFVGEPVALVIAESAGQAEDAAQLVGLDLGPLPVVVDPEAARRPDSPRRSWSCLRASASWSGRPARSHSGCERRWRRHSTWRRLISVSSSATWAVGSARRPALAPS